MEKTTPHELVPAVGKLKLSAIELLQENNLPVADLDDSKLLYVLIRNNELTGVGGLELFEDCALLRSVCIKKELRDKQLGGLLTSALENISSEKGIYNLYLLTTTAKDFFIKRGYEVIDRNSVPQNIKATSEFSELCPSTAVVMKKILR